MEMEVNGRGVEKYSWVANEIRRRIAAGQLPPGSQLPQRHELEESFNVSKVTLQRAMNMLIEDGFIDATRRKGSFVSERPPHLSRYAMAFQRPFDKQERWSRFWMALSNEARQRERDGDCSIPTYYGIDGHVDTEDYLRLSTEVNEHRLAGVIYVADYPRQPNLSFIGESEVPCVLIKSGPESHIPAVNIDEQSLITRALDYLAARGRQRIAFLGSFEFTERENGFLLEQVAARGQSTRPYWIQGLGLDAPYAARNCAHLMMHPGQNERPDGFIITDDNLVEPATIGLMNAGVRVPQDVEIVAHANFPWKTPSVVPVQRLGFNVRDMLAACLKNIDRQRRHEAVPPLTRMPAVFEDEVGHGNYF